MKLKFRVWDKSQNKYLAPDPARAVIYAQTVIAGEKSTGEIDSYKVEQFTGLTGKSGEEIYEGDILKWTQSRQSSKVTGRVYWHRDGWRLTNNKGWSDDRLGVAVLIEVIGNINENKELLDE